MTKITINAKSRLREGNCFIEICECGFVTGMESLFYPDFREFYFEIHVLISLFIRIFTRIKANQLP